jgi:hypothetical protein
MGLKWHHIHPIVRDGELIAANMIVYAEENDEYFSFITAEAYSSLKSWIDYREECGEKVTRDSWVMRNLWDAITPIHDFKQQDIKCFPTSKTMLRIQ